MRFPLVTASYELHPHEFFEVGHEDREEKYLLVSIIVGATPRGCPSPFANFAFLRPCSGHAFAVS